MVMSASTLFVGVLSTDTGSGSVDRSADPGRTGARLSGEARRSASKLPQCGLQGARVRREILQVVVSGTRNAHQLRVARRRLQPDAVTERDQGVAFAVNQQDRTVDAADVLHRVQGIAQQKRRQERVVPTGQFAKA